MTALFATAALALPLAAKVAPSKGETLGPVATSSKLRAPAPKRKQPAACTRKLRSDVAERRAATWQHEDTLDRPRTRTEFRERRTIGCGYLGWLKRQWNGRATRLWPIVVSVRTSEGAIRYVFGQYAEQALAVARCESGHSMTPRAQNGQYLGMFQMGDYARSRYGHGPDPLTQARAAYAYFVDSGRDWSPWQCRPYGLGW